MRRAVLSASITLVLVRLHSRVKVSLRKPLGCTEAGSFQTEIFLEHNASVASGEYENRQRESGECNMKLFGDVKGCVMWSDGHS